MSSCTLFSRKKNDIEAIFDEAEKGLAYDAQLLAKGKEIFSSKLPGNRIFVPRTPSVIKILEALEAAFEALDPTRVHRSIKKRP